MAINMYSYSVQPTSADGQPTGEIIVEGHADDTIGLEVVRYVKGGDDIADDAMIDVSLDELLELHTAITNVLKGAGKL
jgi:hypothetical protein